MVQLTNTINYTAKRIGNPLHSSHYSQNQSLFQKTHNNAQNGEWILKFRAQIAQIHNAKR